MRTSIEALFDAMATELWFTATDGDVESPFGWFAYVTNTLAEVPSILDAFSDTTDVYGVPATDDIVGSFVVSNNSDGQLTIERFATDAAAHWAFDCRAHQYGEWLDAVDA